MTTRMVLCMVLAFAAGFFVAPRTPSSRAAVTPHHPPVSAALHAPRKALERVHFEGRREIADGHAVSAFRIDDPALPDVAGMAKTCLLYEHAEFRSVAWVCP